MNETKPGTSLNLMLAIAGAVLLSLLGAWLVLSHGNGEDETQAISEVIAVDQMVVPVEAVSSDSIESQLSKARLSLEAGMLHEPAGQNALYFLGLVLDEEATHVGANEVLDTVVAELQIRVNNDLANDEFARPYRIIDIIGNIRADAPLIEIVNESIRSRTYELIQSALQAALAGRREDALATLANARSLPGSDDVQIQDANKQILSRLDAHAAAQAEAEAIKEQIASESAVPEWLENAQAASNDGRLINPATDSAMYYLSQAQADDPEAIGFRDELRAAVFAEAERAIAHSELETSEALLDAAVSLGADEETLQTQRANLNVAYAQREAAEMVPTTKMTWRRRVSPVYPRSAERRGTSGIVEIAFTVTDDGNTADIEVLKSEPRNTFDNSAIRAVEQWEFEPRIVRGVVVAQRVGTRLSFTID